MLSSDLVLHKAWDQGFWSQMGNPGIPEPPGAAATTTKQMEERGFLQAFPSFCRIPGWFGLEGILKLNLFPTGRDSFPYPGFSSLWDPTIP